MVKDGVGLSIQNDDGLNIGSGDTWLDIDRAARRVNKTPRFIRRLIAERRIRYYKHGHFIAILKSDLDEWATSNCREPLQ
jgi:excisionase family DNA binding protein